MKIIPALFFTAAGRVRAIAAGVSMLASAHTACADSGSASLSITSSNNSVNYFQGVSISEASLVTLNQVFSLQPGVEYAMRIDATVQAQRNIPGSSGYRAGIDLRAAFGSAPTITGGRHSLDVNASQVTGQPDQIHHEESESLPFSKTFSADVIGTASRSTGTGTYTIQLNGLTLQAIGSVTADVINTNPDFNAAYCRIFTEQFRFTVTQATTMTVTGSLTVNGRGSSQNFPRLPAPGPGPPSAPGGRFTAAPSGEWMDPPLAQGYTFEATGTAHFKEILAFPSGIPAEYYITTEGVRYGPYTPQDSVDFVALRGHGVAAFVLEGIKPFVDAASNVAFPIKLSFTEATANFTMVPVLAPELRVETMANGDQHLIFDGVLEWSPDLDDWSDVTPLATSPHVIPRAGLTGTKFFRSRKP